MLTENDGKVMVEARTRILVLLIAYFLVRVPWLFLVPINQAPDEDAHLWMIRFLAEHLRLPEAAEVSAGGAVAVYGSYPPFGYLFHVLTALLAKFAGVGNDLIFIRCGSVLAGSLMIPCADYIGRTLFKSSRLFAMALPLLLIFHPQLIFVHSYANCDSTTAAIASIILILLVKMLRQGLSRTLSLLTGISLAWLALSKYSGYSMFPTTALTMILASWLHSTRMLSLVVNGLIVTATVGGLSAWWFLRNAAIFDGDYLGTKTMYRTWALTYKRELNFHQSAWSFLENHRWWRTIIYSYWGYFGYLTVEMARPIYLAYQAIMSISILSALFKCAQTLQSGKFAQCIASAKDTEQRAKLIIPAVWTMLAVSFLINLGAMVYASMANYGLAQGRYLFPNEIAIMALLLGGLWLLPDNLNRKAALAVIVFTASTSLYAYFQLRAIPGYGIQ